LIREVAGGELERAIRIRDWPMRDLFLGYIEVLKRDARRTYEIDLLVWSALAPHQRRKTDPPRVPRILRS